MSLPLRERSRPMAPDERRADLARRVIPVLQEHGRDASTRQLAEACGVAEGTLFRAFGDKERLIEAAVAAHFDPRPLHDAIDAIDAALPVERKLAAVLGLLRARFAGAMGLFAALGMRPGAPDGFRRSGDEWLDHLDRLLEPDRAALAAPPRTVGAYLRSVAFASAHARLGTGGVPDDELLRLVTHGVLARSVA